MTDKREYPAEASWPAWRVRAAKLSILLAVPSLVLLGAGIVSGVFQ